MTTPQEHQAEADTFGWCQTIDLGNGVVTKGIDPHEISPGIIPEISGRSVLDIGAGDGKFSFAAEKAGASRVVALDHDAWGVDFVARDSYWEECIRSGTVPDQTRDVTDFWRPDLPGRRGFEFARATLASKVEPLVGDFQEVDLDELGQFDVVLYLDVLHHTEEPLTALERLRTVTKDVAVIETEAVHLQHLDDEVLLQFHAGISGRTHFRTWYVPTIAALHNLCRAAGFARMETIVGPPPPPSDASTSVLQKAVRRASGAGTPEISPPSQNYRAIVHAFA